MVVLAPLLPTSVVRFERPTMYAATVGWLGVPSVPIAVGSPATLLTISTATAPASCALRILVEKVQVPREMSAIFPLSGPVSAVQAVLRDPLEASTTPRGGVRSAFTVAKSLDAAPMIRPPIVTGAPTK